MSMDGAQRPYLSYLLRLWLVDTDGLVWRASLENPTTAERHGFATLEKLIAFLLAETKELAAEEAWNRAANQPSERPPGQDWSSDEETNRGNR